MTSALPAAVLWDMDGTLVDTEGYWMAAETALVESFGGTWTHEQALTLVGSGLERSAEILQEAGVRMSVTDIVDHLSDAVSRTLAEQGNPFRPGARELLAQLKEAGVRTALVTMSLRSMADTVAGQMGFDAFDLVVAGDEVTRPKPFPDPYLQACAQLDVDPADAVALEDSPTGVRAAVAAGVATVGIPLMVSLTGAGADAVWPTLEGRTPADLAEFHAAHRAARTTEVTR
ncbi:HAD family hydrolase [Microbacterium telephonicum]|uniref:HAD superfamily hydrolase (TIGR01509 family) n=1 Tax=Microbacterium telephonicum TaxID=1714841 RepID=A0A498BZW6_9MICO|nr:HAD family phosphatase [Microbacterium telephonicum]RLK49254.1 HAD superfamily hydrolase (TIGR01509 family) [Microbacterium telephonicum]